MAAGRTGNKTQGGVVTNAVSLDRIHLRDLSIRCIIGLNDWERKKRQEVCLNITLFADLSAPCKSDDIEDTVDYKSLKNKIVAMVELSEFLLLERLADAIAHLCLDIRQVRQVDVTVDKPGALRFARSVAVEIHREKSSG